MTLTPQSTGNADFPSRIDAPVRWWLSGLQRRSWTRIAVCGATFMLLMDITIVQVALPTIQGHLGGSFTDLQWVIDAYALMLAAFILTCGSVADRFGHKTVFVTGLGVFIRVAGLRGCRQHRASDRRTGASGPRWAAIGLALIGQEFRAASAAGRSPPGAPPSAPRQRSDR